MSACVIISVSCKRKSVHLTITEQEINHLVLGKSHVLQGFFRATDTIASSCCELVNISPTGSDRFTIVVVSW